MSNDEIVHSMVEMYTLNAAINISDPKFRDSLREQYFTQFAAISKRDVEVVKSDFDKLLLMPDTLASLQNRALDTIRLLQEKANQPTTPIKLGIN